MTRPSNSTYRIGDVARITGLSQRMIRYYEDKEVITTHRSASDQRLFNDEDIRRLAVMTVLRRAGLSVREAKDWMQAGVDFQDVARRHLDQLRDRLAQIRASVTALERIISSSETDWTPARISALLDTTQIEADQARSRAFFLRHFDAEDQAEWAALHDRIGSITDRESYFKAWERLTHDINANLNAPPDSELAQALLARFDDLLSMVGSALKEGQSGKLATLYANPDQWSSAADQPFTVDTARFIQKVRVARSDLEPKT